MKKIYLISFIWGDYEKYFILAKTKREVIERVKKRGIKLSGTKISKLEYELF